jgi:O-glycosyl hydrolase
MKLTKNGEFSMNRVEVAEFSFWLDSNPKERYKRFNEVVHAFIAYKKRAAVEENEWILEEAL